MSGAVLEGLGNIAAHVDVIVTYVQTWATVQGIATALTS